MGCADEFSIFQAWVGVVCGVNDKFMDLDLRQKKKPVVLRKFATKWQTTRLLRKVKSWELDRTGNTIGWNSGPARQNFQLRCAGIKSERSKESA
jgi:hypothetical protein